MSTDPESLPGLEVDELLAKIKRSHSLYYKMINIEIWALVETLDQFFPGSWNRFMTNRQTSMKQFLERQRNKTKPPKKEEENEDKEDKGDFRQTCADLEDKGDKADLRRVKNENEQV